MSDKFTVAPCGRFFFRASASRCIGAAIAGFTVREALHSSKEIDPPHQGRGNPPPVIVCINARLCSFD